MLGPKFYPRVSGVRICFQYIEEHFYTLLYRQTTHTHWSYQVSSYCILYTWNRYAYFLYLSSMSLLKEIFHQMPVCFHIWDILKGQCHEICDHFRLILGPIWTGKHSFDFANIFDRNVRSSRCQRLPSVSACRHCRVATAVDYAVETKTQFSNSIKLNFVLLYFSKVK